MDWKSRSLTGTFGAAMLGLAFLTGNAARKSLFAAGETATHAALTKPSPGPFGQPPVAGMIAAESGFGLAEVVVCSGLSAVSLICLGLAIAPPKPD